MKQSLIILGASGNCLDILDAVLDGAACGLAVDCLGFLDDNPALQHSMVQSLPVLGPLTCVSDYPHAYFVNGIGNFRRYRQKEALIRSCGLDDSRFLSVVSPMAHLARSAHLGTGSVILAHSAVAAQAQIGKHVMVLQHAIINHDCRVEDFATIAAGVNIAGGCSVGKGAYIGSSASIRDGIHIGDYALVGMGAVVTKNVPPHAIVFGNPARQQ